MNGSWHHDRDGYGTVLGPKGDDGLYPILGSGWFYADAVSRFGPLERVDAPIPVTVDVKEAGK